MIDAKTALAQLAIRLAEVLAERDHAVAVAQALTKRVSESETKSESGTANTVVTGPV